MSIRIRTVDGVRVALCAARSMPKEGDVYLDDADHQALSEKLAEDFQSMGFKTRPLYPNETAVRQQEESNNPNREWWDSVYAKPKQRGVPGRRKGSKSPRGVCSLCGFEHAVTKAGFVFPHTVKGEYHGGLPPATWSDPNLVIVRDDEASGVAVDSPAVEPCEP